jgi:CheY-like chemotaxis protein
MQVLVAHHDRWTRLVLAETLTRAGYDVAEASNGMAALRLAAHLRPELMVLSAQLSELATADVRAALKANPSTRAIGVFVVRARRTRPAVPVVAAYGSRCRAWRSGRTASLRARRCGSAQRSPAQRAAVSVV